MNYLGISPSFLGIVPFIIQINLFSLQRESKYCRDMKKMIIMAVLSLFAILPTEAQYRIGRYPTSHSRVQQRYGYRENFFGLRIGPAFTSVHSDDDYLDSGLQTGINIGMAAGFNIAYRAPLYLETGLYYTEKGGNTKLGGAKMTYDLNYLEVPLVVKYIYEVDPDFNVQPFLGVYGAIGIGGKVKNFGDRVATSSFSNNLFRRGDAGIRIGCGLGFDMFYADITYDLGLANISDDSFDTATNGALMINVGMNF
ncbi:MAG: PorT family protein [Prevotella sp.]|nr:PorT family protein [Prevotella sp.]